MATKSVFTPPKRKQVNSLEEAYHDLSGQDELVKLIDYKDLIPNRDNPYPITELEDLIGSIKQFGVEQNLVVQIQGDQFSIITGHRRYHAIKHILENDHDGEYEHLIQVYCKIIDENEDATLIRLRLHDTNLQARPLNKMSNDEKTAIIEEYLALIKEAKDKNLRISGKVVKGKTRMILANLLGLSEGTAQKYIKMVNEKDEEKQGDKFVPPRKVKTPADELQAICKKLSKLEYEGTEEEQDLKEEIVRLLWSDVDAGYD